MYASYPDALALDGDHFSELEVEEDEVTESTQRFCIFLVILSPLLFTACAPKTMTLLRQEPSATHTFTVAQPYVPVYRTILERSRMCYGSSGLGGHMAIEHDLVDEPAHGIVQVVAYAVVPARRVVLGVDVVGVGRDQTRVTVYAGMGVWRGAMRAVEAWVLEGSEACKA